MLKAMRHFLVLLIVFAIVGGTTSELARSAQYAGPMTMAGMLCDSTLPASASGDTKPMPPCKGMTPDCIKLMGCVTVTALPARFLTHEMTVRYSTVTYWTGASTLASLDPEPEPLPPRTI